MEPRGIPEALLSGNRLLAGLDEAGRGRVAQVSRHERLKRREVLFEAGADVDLVFFPLAGMVSLVNVLGDGVGVEVAAVGAEGMVGEENYLTDMRHTNLRGVVQVDCELISLSVSSFRELVPQMRGFGDILKQYIRVRMAIAVQEIGCNRRHSLEQRCARWLLMTSDRCGTERFPLTQEFLAQMMGTRRPTVSEIAQSLSNAGAIQYTRGVIEIADRAALEEIACECYEVIKREFDRLG